MDIFDLFIDFYNLETFGLDNRLVVRRENILEKQKKFGW